jgi:hypothetical protein
MGWLDKAKVALGIIDPEDVEDEGPPRARKRVKLDGSKDGRPSLDNFEAAPQETLDDVLEAREAGDLEEMRTLLRRIDRGRGLRVVLRAAAALEADDDDELKKLLPKVAAERPTWKLPLQLAAVLEDDDDCARLRAEAEAAKAPKWALCWMTASSPNEQKRRHGLVDLLFTDAPLARTVAARDLGVEGAEADTAAGKRYVSFAHGRECIRRFGADLVLRVYDAAHGRDA